MNRSPLTEMVIPAGGVVYSMLPALMGSPKGEMGSAEAERQNPNPSATRSTVQEIRFI